MTTNEEIKKSARLRKIMQVMRKYHFVSNFYHQTNPQAICQALQELGPTFIKLGQILSTRPDLVSPAYIKELRHLQDQVKADSFATVEQTFEEETGKKINDEFASFAEKPFARLDKFTMQRLRMGHQLLSKFNIQKSVSLLVLT